MKSETVKDLLEGIDNFRRTPSGNVIIHYDGSFIELKEEFVQQLKKDLEVKMNLVIMGLDKISALEKFAILVLDEAF